MIFKATCAVDVSISDGLTMFKYPFRIINYLNRGAQGIDIVALGIDFVAVRAWAQSVCRLE